MEFGEAEIKKLSTILLITVLAILAFILIRPVILSIITGLIIAYIFYPLYLFLNQRIKNKSLTAGLVSIFAILIIVIPLWFLIPFIGNQIFALFSSSQGLDIATFVRSIFPSASEQFIGQLTVTTTSIITQATSSSLNVLINFFLDLPSLLLHFFVILFVFYFTLKDAESLQKFVSDLSPLSKSKARLMVQQFKDITNSIIYGQIIVGLVQGAFAGIGFLIFGIDNALVLTIIATFLSITPIVGPFIVWIPIAIYLFASGQTNLAFIYLLYNLLIVSTIDNVVRSYLISRKTNVSAPVILVGMIGGLFIFGIIGVLLGPLIIAYFITFLKFYKDKNVYSLFSDDEKIKKGE